MSLIENISVLYGEMSTSQQSRYHKLSTIIITGCLVLISLSNSLHTPDQKFVAAKQARVKRNLSQKRFDQHKSVVFVKLVCVKFTKIYSILNKVIVDYRLSSYSQSFLHFSIIIDYLSLSLLYYLLILIVFHSIGKRFYCVKWALSYYDLQYVSAWSLRDKFESPDTQCDQ